MTKTNASFTKWESKPIRGRASISAATAVLKRKSCRSPVTLRTVLCRVRARRRASPPEAGYELYERESSGKLRLLQQFLASLTMECGGRVCIGTLAPNAFEATGTTAEDTEGLVDFARSIDGVEIGVLIEERPEGGVKASLRAKDPLCRLDLAAGQFGGGGHACAAGLNQKKANGDFRERLLEVLRERLRVVDAERAKLGA